MNYAKSSFLDDFELPEITHENVKQKLLKVGTTQSVKRNSFESMPLEERLKMVEKEVLKILGRYRGFVRVIRTREELHNYISTAIEKNYLAFDTETNNSLDALTCKLMGLCMYIPNTRPVYVPINHCKPGTDERLDNQITEQDAKEELQRLKESNTRIVYHNGKFDIRVCYNVLGFYLPIWWDTMIAAQMLDENDLAKLKYQYKTKIDATAGSYDIEHLFKGLPYAWINPDIFSLYAAIDSYDTSRLQKYQQGILEEKGMEKFYNLFLNVEIPVVSVVASMEDNGVCVDLDFLKKIDTKYRKEIDRINKNIEEILQPYQDTIQYYQGLGQLDTPINLDSTTQLPLLLYDIMKIPTVDGTKSTKKETLQIINLPITKALLEYRHYKKLITSFTTPLSSMLSVKDNKLHANFNQLGKEEDSVRTGRFSSTDPKQNWGFTA